MMSNYLDSQRMLRMVRLEQVGIKKKKTILEVPIEFRVSCGKQESRLIIPRGLGILTPELLAVSGS